LTTSDQDRNPYAAPVATVADVDHASGNFSATGRIVSAGQGSRWLGAAWDLFKQQPGMWIVFWIVYFVITAVVSVVPLVNFLNSLIAPVFMAGWMIAARDVEEGQRLELGTLFAGFKTEMGNLVLLGVLYLAAIIVVVFVVGVLAAIGVGMLGIGGALAGGGAGALAALTGGALIFVVLGALLVVALTLPLAAAMWFAPALVVLNQIKPLDAMKASFGASLRNFLPMLVYGLLLLVFAIVAAIPLFLGYLVFLPLVFLSIYTSYRDIFYTA
jgi:uncharacterized membrane protein